MSWHKPDRLVPLDLVREIPERLSADGSVVRALDEVVARERIQQLSQQGVEAIAISLLHSYMNPAHERRVRELVQEVAPDLAVTCSSDVLPEYREYERTMTTVLNAYVMPVVGDYLSAIDRRLSQEAFDVDVQIVRSDAGIMSLQAAREHPVNTVLSGPAGGVDGTHALRRTRGSPVSRHVRHGRHLDRYLPQHRRRAPPTGPDLGSPTTPSGSPSSTSPPSAPGAVRSLG